MVRFHEIVTFKHKITHYYNVKLFQKLWRSFHYYHSCILFIFLQFRSSGESRSPLWTFSITHDTPHPAGLLWTNDPTRSRDLYLQTQNPHKRQIFMPTRGIRTCNPRKRAAADAHLRPRGHPGPANFVNYLNIFKWGCEEHILGMKGGAISRKPLVWTASSCNILTLYAPCIILQYVYEPTRCSKFLWLEFIFH